jgi:hypothetical protein
MFYIRLLIAICLCLIWSTSRAQTVDSKLVDPKFKIGVNTIYMAQFTVREASDRNVRITGVRLSFSDYDAAPWEIGAHVYGGYGDVATASFGVSVAYLITGPKFQFKMGLSLSTIFLEDTEVDEDIFDPQVGDVSFSDFSTEIKPYIELEWEFSRYSSLFVNTGYRIINGERAVVTEVEQREGPLVSDRVSARDENVFFSASGIEFGVGLSINFPLK